MRAGVIVAGLLMGMLVVSGCGPEEENGAQSEESATPTQSQAPTPAQTPAQAQPKEEAPAPVAAKLTPEDRRHREMLRGGLAQTHPEATEQQLTCASDQILERMGWDRFETIVIQEMGRARGQDPQPTPQTVQDRATLDTIIFGCGMETS